MSFNSYEELMQAVEERRAETLTLDLDLGARYSQEHEDAKAELAQAKALKTFTGNQEFLADNLDRLAARVAETKPPKRSIWVRFSKLSLTEWTLLTKQTGLSPIEQYEKVLPKTFIGVYGSDPEEAEEKGETPVPLTAEPISVSSRGGDKAVVSGGMLHSLVQAFMAWQNSSGEVTIRPTKSGRD